MTNVIHAWLRRNTNGHFAYCEECLHATDEGKCHAPQMSQGLFRGDVEIDCAEARMHGWLKSFIKNTCGVTARHFKYAGERAAEFDRDKLRVVLEKQSTGKKNPERVLARKLKTCASCLYVAKVASFTNEEFWQCKNTECKKYCDHQTAGRYAGCEHWEEMPQ